MYDYKSYIKFKNNEKIKFKNDMAHTWAKNINLNI